MTKIAPSIASLELRLKTQKDPKQRMVLLDQLTAHYAYTDVPRALLLLDELQDILGEHYYPDFATNYLINRANAENLLYNFEEAEAFCLRAIQLIEERGTSNQQAEVYIDFAAICMNLGEHEEATQYLEKAEKAIKSFPSAQLKARLICREGHLHLKSSNFSVAIELFLEAEKRMNALNSLSIKDRYFQTLIFSGLGKVFELNNEQEKSIRYYLKTLELCEKYGMMARISWHYLNLGVGYMSLDNLTEAEPYYQKAIETTDDINTYPRASSYANLGYCRLVQKEYQEALELFELAEKLFKEIQEEDYRNFAMIASWRGRLHTENDQPMEAIYHYRMSNTYAEKVDDNKQLANTCKELAAVYASLGDFKLAYDYQVYHDRFFEKYMGQANKQKQMEIEVRYEAEKKKREAEVHKLRATKLQLKALRAQMNPHFMYNALNSIQNYITSNEITSASKYLAKFAKLMRQSLDNSDLEIISLEKEIEFLENYLMINEKLRFEDKLSYRIYVDDEIEEDILGVPTMIIQPYVENAIEHGLRTCKNGMIQVKFGLLDEDTILCTVEDNGIGRVKARQLQMNDPQFQNHKSRGTSITEERLKILHNSSDDLLVETIDLYHEKTGEAIGTRVEIKIPIVEVQVN